MAHPLQLDFSQLSEPTPSGQLGCSFGSLRLSSQPQGSQLTQERPPVPLFSDAPAAGPGPGPSCSQQPVDMLGSQEVLGTQDFITPADQFGLEYDPAGNGAAGGVPQQRSPARLSPNRVKRPRKDDDAMDDDCGEAPPAGGAGRAGVPEQALGRPAVPRRARSPPCYRSCFREEDEDCFAAWTAPRSGWAGDSHYKVTFKEIGQLGQGNFSKVFRARHRINGREYAVKRTTRELTPDNPAFAQFIQEAQVLAHLPPHPNVVGYYGSWAERGPGGGDHLYHQLEKCDISLGALAALREAIREPELLEVLRQMCLALRHLHSCGVAHLDVKPDNIYTACDEGQEHEGLGHEAAAGGCGTGGRGEAARRSYKLGDFGQATRFDRRSAVNVNEGDCRYLPLELLNSDYRWLDKADMFALGATMFELASRSELPSGGALYQDLRHGKVPLLPNISTSLLKLIRSLLSLNPEERPSADRVLASALLNKKPSAPAAAAAPPALQSQGSTASAQSAQSIDCSKYGGLVLQRSVHS